MTNVYKMRLGRGGNWEDQAIGESIIRIGFGIAASLSKMSQKSEIEWILKRDSKQLTQKQIKIRTFQINLFVNEMTEGDFVLVDLKTRRKTAVGRIVGRYFQQDRDMALRPVEWLRLDIDSNELCEDLRGPLSNWWTISEVQVVDAVVRIEQIIATGKDPGPSGDTETVPEASSYAVEDIVDDGCFVEPERISNMLKRLQSKKNLILQGPPGTGKTWLAKRLAWALVGRKDASRVRAVQFHPNLSYEDFVRGWRPSSDGTLDLVDGPFLEMVKAANRDAEDTYALVIEEVNRGNPAQILGEMLTLLEADKRNPDNALELTYKRQGEQGIYLPPNLHVVGTMNIADRSLALVDLALRRRFAFVDLVPEIGKRWKDWGRDRCGFDESVLSDIQDRVSNLNETIESDSKLGRQFQIGHSYVTPPPGIETDPGTWYRDVVNSEIGPLLDEYWFDEPSKARREQEKLLQGLDWL